MTRMLVSATKLEHDCWHIEADRIVDILRTTFSNMIYFHDGGGYFDWNFPKFCSLRSVGKKSQWFESWLGGKSAQITESMMTQLIDVAYMYVLPYPRTIGCCYNTVQQNLILHATHHWLWQNIHHSLLINSHHFSPSWASNCEVLEKISWQYRQAPCWHIDPLARFKVTEAEWRIYALADWPPNDSWCVSLNNQEEFYC